MSRPISAHIDTQALRHNFQVARHHAGQTPLWAVIKANAYGHGLMRVAEALAPVADGFAMLDVAEALAVREAGMDLPILMLEGFFDAADLPVFAEYRLTPVVHNLYQVESLMQAALPARIDVYVKLNSGMNRLGFREDAFPAVLTALETCPQVGRVTLMTHFASADGEGVDEQLDAFFRIVDGCDFPLSLANSAALLRYPQTLSGWARPGIMLYGGSPFADQTAEALGLVPVMTLASEVIGVQEIEACESVGYGGTFVAPSPMRVGVVACGYADGYPRHAATGTPVLVDGVRTKTLGRVSMDMLVVDLTELPDADVGSPAVLWGQGLPADEVATAAGTISYELFCALAPRVPVFVR